MKQLQELYTEAVQFRGKRARLAENVLNVDGQFREAFARLESAHNAALETLETERQAAIAVCESRVKREIQGYSQKKQSLQSFLGPASQWCPKGALQSYRPKAERVNEAELNELVRMLQEEGIIAWVKRTFHLGGYSSRAEMALELSQKIEDACAYCQAKIDDGESKLDRERAAYTTDARRKTDAENKAYNVEKMALEQKKQASKERALAAAAAFNTSRELRALHARMEKMRLEGEDACGMWGEYAVPQKMPRQVLLCDVSVALPNESGVDTMQRLPLWLDLFKSNIIVLTSGSSSVAGPDSPDKKLVRQLLARMVKTIPPECCSYSIFDSLHKGDSLERLIDIKNIGATELNFDLFTTTDPVDGKITCAERRKYLRNRPEDIIRCMAGRSRSLFEYNRELGDFEFPFTWIVDFNFPEKLDSRMETDYKELFVNASAAGYSFVLVTTPQGYENLRQLAETCTSTPILRVDLDAMTCNQGELTLPIQQSNSPSPDQIYNFMTALKKHYDDGAAVDNSIKAVFAKYGIKLRDCSKKLAIPMALDSRGRLIDLELGGSGSVHGFISGNTNSGKSTLLHTIILSACLHYTPSDLEIWLVDYKQTEFYMYRKNCPPHIKLIGVSKTPDFTFSLLDKIQAEAERRAWLMHQFDVANLADYRKHAGEPGYENIPRLFIVIDEFHEMSQFVEGEEEYRNKLENILRETRTMGITCLLADQTFSSGLRGLTPAAKNQIGLRIAMRNETAPQEVKDTLEVDHALYSDSMQRTIDVMSQGDFIMKVYVRNSRGDLTDIRLEKFKALLTKGEDIPPVGKSLRALYKGRFDPKGLLYINTKEQVPWDDTEIQALDQAEPLRRPNIRLYLGHTATLRPCFGLDLGRQPDENLSIVGGTAFQRWELLHSIIRSCRQQNYRLLVFMAEYSDLYCDFAEDIRALCQGAPNAELMETTAQWCAKLEELEEAVKQRIPMEDTVCMFIGLEIADIEFSRLPGRDSQTPGIGSNILAYMSALATPVPGTAPAPSPEPSKLTEFNAGPLIDTLFSSGARCGIRCVAEISVYRQFAKILKIRDMCRHKIAFSMSADDCLMYLGNSSFQKSIGQYAVYSNGGKEVKKLLPYKI